MTRQWQWLSYNTTSYILSRTRCPWPVSKNCGLKPKLSTSWGFLFIIKSNLWGTYPMKKNFKSLSSLFILFSFLLVTYKKKKCWKISSMRTIYINLQQNRFYLILRIWTRILFEIVYTCRLKNTTRH